MLGEGSGRSGRVWIQGAVVPMGPSSGGAGMFMPWPPLGRAITGAGELRLGEGVSLAAGCFLVLGVSIIQWHGGDEARLCVDDWFFSLV